MKIKLLLIFVLLIQTQLKAQSYLWAHSAGNSKFNHLSSLKKDKSGDIYLTTYDDSGGTILNTRIEKRNSSNTVLWNMDLSGGAVIVDVEINSQNHPVFTGYYSGNLNVDTVTLHSPLIISAFLIETFDNGNLFWAVNFNPDTNDFKPVDLFIDNSDNLYLTAELTGGSSHGFCSFHKLDLWGNPIRDEFNDNFDNRTFSHIIADNAGNVYLSGTCGNLATFDSLTVGSSSYQNMLVKYNSDFNAQWVITRPYITFDHNNGLGSDGQSLYWSFVEATSNNDTVKILKTDYNGQILIDFNCPFTTNNFPYITLGTDSSGNNLIALNKFNSIFLYRYNNQFNLEWQDTIAAQISGFPSEVQVACYDSSFYIGSRYFSDSVYFDSLLVLNPNPATFSADVFIAKWGYNNLNSVPTINANSLGYIFPNPANEEINFYYPENIPAILTVSDYLGKTCLIKNISDSGNYSFDLSELNSGLYIIKLTVKDFSYYKKILVQH